MNEIRKDYILDRYVVISTKRGKRPDAFRQSGGSERKDQCPFCPGNEDSTPELIDEIPEEDWQFRLFPNKFPALNKTSFEVKDGDSIFTRLNSYGFHEVLVETPEHGKRFCELDESKINQYLDILNERYVKLKSKEDISYVSIFKNKGEEAGESIGHAHSQLIASPVVPEEVSKLTDRSREIYEKEGQCPYCRVIEVECESDERVIAETENFVVISPYASVWPYESMILPKRHVSELNSLNDGEKSDLSRILKALLEKYHDLFGDPSYNLMYYSFPKASYTHFHVAIKPKLKVPGGFEEFGLYINEVSPESAAGDLKLTI